MGGEARVRECGERKGQKHIVWVDTWIDYRYDLPIPTEGRFDNHDDAIEWAERRIVDPPDTLRWIKIFPAESGEMYVCWIWQNPAPEPPQPDARPLIPPRRSFLDWLLRRPAPAASSDTEGVE